MYIQRFVIAAIVLPLAIAAPIAGVASTSTTLRARQILWTLLGPLGFEPVVDGVNGALVGLGLK
ncbi:hypothetical protein BCIN_01g07900 [Botrytis cinerea B05.10]|uniref:Uncharacterized protein n=2 Tax=Botryotinia fuckeliana TaxID=40559 RepID=A0A384J6A3_BOTFB|nr:hypothetical protein BCIN_01g07900 [Botrytis cinerea B05.10]ATZ46136.1 hypothetical protein BCIN_01g07900 [Botrytis cinerea B05.10]CCD45855.1 hypothetical protein BofuT4_uP048730.1 [Botrytis cinerea T4]